MDKRFKESEIAFDKKFQALIEKRVCTEEKLRVMEAKPPKDLADYIQALEREEERDAERREVGQFGNKLARRYMTSDYLTGRHPPRYGGGGGRGKTKLRRTQDPGSDSPLADPEER